jgi:hypothetical protein
MKIRCLIQYLAIASFFFLIGSCNQFDNSGIPINPDKDTKLSVAFEAVVNNSNDITLGKYYSLKNGDSIVIERLDFYVSSMTSFNSDSSKALFGPLSFYSKFNSKNTFIFDYSKYQKEILRLSFITGLTAEQNATDPSTISDASNPLSASKQMYWTKWTKYRFVVFEGRIKNTNGSIIPFSYHTGLVYGSSSVIKCPMTLTSGSVNPMSIVLHIDKIFYPDNTALNIDYNHGETQAHSDPNDEVLSSKFATNFGSAYTVK